MLLGRHVDDKAGDPACVGQSRVIGDKGSQLPAYAQGSCKMDRVETGHVECV